MDRSGPGFCYVLGQFSIQTLLYSEKERKKEKKNTCLSVHCYIENSSSGWTKLKRSDTGVCSETKRVVLGWCGAFVVGSGVVCAGGVGRVLRG